MTNTLESTRIVDKEFNGLHPFRTEVYVNIYIIMMRLMQNMKYII